MKQAALSMGMSTHPSAIRVLIVDDHLSVRRGIKALLAQTSDIQIAGEATNGQEAICLAKDLQPDVILMDLLMPQMDGVEATRQILARQPGIRVLVLTSFVQDEKIHTAIKADASGYVLKDSDPFELIQSIYRVQRGKSDSGLEIHSEAGQGNAGDCRGKADLVGRPSCCNS